MTITRIKRLIKVEVEAGPVSVMKNGKDLYWQHQKVYINIVVCKKSLGTLQRNIS